MPRFFRLQLKAAAIWIPADLLVCYLFETTFLGVFAFSVMIGVAGGLNALHLERK